MPEQRTPSEDPGLDAEDEASWRSDEVDPAQVATPLRSPELSAGAPEPRAEFAPQPQPRATAWLGVFAGLMVAYSAAWCVIVATTGTRAVPQLIPGVGMIWTWGAALAPLVWAAMVTWALHGRLARWGAAVLGIVVLFPLPLVLSMIGTGL
jgi:hypothetical protein